MKLRYVKPSLALLLVLGVSFVVAVGLAVATVHVLDWRVIGSGNVVIESVSVTEPCLKIGPRCKLMSNGSVIESPQVLRTHLGDSSYFFGVTTGTHTLDAPSALSPSGSCFTASGVGTVTAANGIDVISFNTVGLLCEEGDSGTDLHYNGTYRITGGTGLFANVVGGGSLVATFERTIGGVAFIKIDGVINF